MAGATRVGRADGKVSRERLYVSPYVEKPLNSKVIKSFVPELRSRECFSCFGIPMFYVCIYEHYMYVSHILVWVCYILYILFPENICLFSLISWFVLYLILQAFTNPMFLSTNSLSIDILFPENISLFPIISWFVLYLILQAFTNPMFLSTNSLSIDILFPENISLFPLISWFVLYLILQAFTNQNATRLSILIMHSY